MDAGIDRYDDKYRRAHYFRYRQWLYRPFVNALINKANLRAVIAPERPDTVRVLRELR
jgi:hypothetical protein